MKRGGSISAVHHRAKRLCSCFSSSSRPSLSFAVQEKPRLMPSERLPLGLNPVGSSGGAGTAVIGAAVIVHRRSFRAPRAFGMCRSLV